MRNREAHPREEAVVSPPQGDGSALGSLGPASRKPPFLIGGAATASLPHWRGNAFPKQVHRNQHPQSQSCGGAPYETDAAAAAAGPAKALSQP
jgi:hypothetical protein